MSFTLFFKIIVQSKPDCFLVEAQKRSRAYVWEKEQFPYAGYMPNRPTINRRLMPEPGTPEFEELKSDPTELT